MKRAESFPAVAGARPWRIGRKWPGHTADWGKRPGRTTDWGKGTKGGTEPGAGGEPGEGHVLALVARQQRRDRRGQQRGGKTTRLASGRQEHPSMSSPFTDGEEDATE
jgi:hypothetical protein